MAWKSLIGVPSPLVVVLTSTTTQPTAMSGVHNPAAGEAARDAVGLLNLAR
jgi:hypothetical protein